VSGRIRTLKPEYFTDERVADLSYKAAYAFPGLWLHADRAGLLEDKPRELKAKLAPLRKDFDMEAVLAELATAGLILRYVIDGKRYISIPNLPKHQAFNKHEPESRFPAPTLEHVQARAGTCEHVHAPLEGKGKEWNGKEWNGKEGNGSSRSLALAEVSDDFDVFYEAYPRKKQPDDARKAWQQTADRRPPLEDLLAAVKWQREQAEWRREGGRFIPYPATWLRAGQWGDQPSEVPPVVNPKTIGNRAALSAFVARGVRHGS